MKFQNYIFLSLFLIISPVFAGNVLTFDYNDEFYLITQNSEYNPNNTQKLPLNVCNLSNNNQIIEQVYISNSEKFYAVSNTIYSKSEIIFEKNIATDSRINILKVFTFTKQADCNKLIVTAKKNAIICTQSVHASKTYNEPPKYKTTVRNSSPFNNPSNGLMISMANKTAVASTIVLKTKKFLEKLSTVAILKITNEFYNSIIIKNLGLNINFCSNTSNFDIIYFHISRPPPSSC